LLVDQLIDNEWETHLCDHRAALAMAKLAAAEDPAAKREVNKDVKFERTMAERYRHMRLLLERDFAAATKRPTALPAGKGKPGPVQTTLEEQLALLPQRDGSGE
jgi:hypothetical protein